MDRLRWLLTALAISQSLGTTMTVSFADIEQKFNRVFGFIQSDLERILTLDPGGELRRRWRGRVRLRNASSVSVRQR